MNYYKYNFLSRTLSLPKYSYLFQRELVFISILFCIQHFNVLKIPNKYFTSPMHYIRKILHKSQVLPWPILSDTSKVG